jgi:hypothetical protein
MLARTDVSLDLATCVPTAPTDSSIVSTTPPDSPVRKHAYTTMHLINNRVPMLPDHQQNFLDVEDELVDLGFMETLDSVNLKSLKHRQWKNLALFCSKMALYTEYTDRALLSSVSTPCSTSTKRQHVEEDDEEITRKNTKINSRK